MEDDTNVTMTTAFESTKALAGVEKHGLIMDPQFETPQVAAIPTSPTNKKRKRADEERIAFCTLSEHDKQHKPDKVKAAEWLDENLFSKSSDNPLRKDDIDEEYITNLLSALDQLDMQSLFSKYKISYTNLVKLVLAAEDHGIKTPDLPKHFSYKPLSGPYRLPALMAASLSIAETLEASKWCEACVKKADARTTLPCTVVPGFFGDACLRCVSTNRPSTCSFYNGKRSVSRKKRVSDVSDESKVANPNGHEPGLGDLTGRALDSSVTVSEETCDDVAGAVTDHIGDLMRWIDGENDSKLDLLSIAQNLLKQVEDLRSKNEHQPEPGHAETEAADAQMEQSA